MPDHGPRFADLLEAAPDAMVIVDGRGCIVLVNAQTEHLFGFRREELLGEPVETLIPERFRAAHAGHRAGYVKSPERARDGVRARALRSRARTAASSPSR